MSLSARAPHIGQRTGVRSSAVERGPVMSDLDIDISRIAKGKQLIRQTAPVRIAKTPATSIEAASPISLNDVYAECARQNRKNSVFRGTEWPAGAINSHQRRGVSRSKPAR